MVQASLGRVIELTNESVGGVGLAVFGGVLLTCVCVHAACVCDCVHVACLCSCCVCACVHVAYVLVLHDSVNICSGHVYI